MFTIARSNGAKSIKSPRDIMKLPLLDGADEQTRKRLVERLKAFKEKHGTTIISAN